MKGSPFLEEERATSKQQSRKNVDSEPTVPSKASSAITFKVVDMSQRMSSEEHHIRRINTFLCLSLGCTMDARSNSMSTSTVTGTFDPFAQSTNQLFKVQHCLVESTVSPMYLASVVGLLFTLLCTISN